MRTFAWAVMLVLAVSCRAAEPPGGALTGERYRLLVSSDIGGSDPDDIQSMIHLMFYADLFDIEGLVASPPGKGRKRDILEVIDAYARDYPKLAAKSKRFPRPEVLRGLAKQGAVNPAPPVGYATPTEGSRWIIRCAKKPDRRPLYVLVWGSITDVAQALHDDPSIKKKLRVHFIGAWNTKMDPHARNYVFNHHRDLWLIENNTAHVGMYSGGRQDGDWSNDAFPQKYLAGHGALGDLFMQKMARLKMGDTPSLLYLMRGDPARPELPHWGGQYRRTDHGPNYWTDPVEVNAARRTVSRWREAYLGDWRQRLLWLE